MDELSSHMRLKYGHTGEVTLTGGVHNATALLGNATNKNGSSLGSKPAGGYHAPTALVRADCAYADRMYMLAFASRNSKWQISRQSSDCCHAAIQLDEYEEIDWSRVLGPPFMVASSYCMRKGLGRKGNMAASLSAHAARCKHEGGCPLRTALPETVPIDTTSVFIARPPMVDFHSAMAEALFEAEEAMARDVVGSGLVETGAGAMPVDPTSGRCVTGERMVQGSHAWILKPSITNKGSGIELVTTIEEVSTFVRAIPEMGQWVLQRYIPRPLRLLGNASTGVPGHKFHLRVYVLAVGAITVYLYHEALVLIAVKPYSDADLSDRAAHITNTCVGSVEEGFHEETHVRALAELPQLLVECGRCSTLQDGQRLRDKVYSDTRSIIAHSFAAQEAAAGGYMPLPRCFELYGVDIMVDEDERTWLLEFNPSPDIKQTGGRLGYVIEGMVEGVVQIAIDRRVRPVGAGKGAGGEGVGSSVATQGGCCAQHGAMDDAHRIEVDVEPALPAAGSGMEVLPDGCVVPRKAASLHGGGSAGNGAAVSGAGAGAGAQVPAHSRPFVCPDAVRQTVDPSGWDMVYTKKWNQAHGATRMTVT